MEVHSTVKSLTSEVTPSATNFFKRAYKISHPPRFALPIFATLSKMGPDFSKKVVVKLKLPKNNFNKKCAPKFLLFNEKNQKDLDDL